MQTKDVCIKEKNTNADKDSGTSAINADVILTGESVVLKWVVHQKIVGIREKVTTMVNYSGTNAINAFVIVKE